MFAFRSPPEWTRLCEQALERKFGEEKFDSLTPEDQDMSCARVFGGCCSQKDLNVLRYGYAEVQRIYAAHDLPPPALRANKANSATISLGTADSAAVQRAVEYNSASAIKLLQLIGSLLQHKDGECGYQDKCTLFM
jgi:hypothetical protein